MVSSYKRLGSKDRKMASKRGIATTIVILAAITGASFIFWMLPQDNPSTFIVTDYKGYLDGVKKIHEVLEESIDIEFQNLMDGNISPEEYIIATEVTSSQVTAQITEFVKSKPPEEWQVSYISYMDALRKFNSYVLETKIAANTIQNNGDLEQHMQKIEMLKKEYLELVDQSDKARP